LIRLSAKIEEGIITSISIRGDFFASPEEGFDRVEGRLVGTKAVEAAASFDSFLKEEAVEAAGINGAALGELLASAMDAAGESARG
jgi:hypothetical protein